MEVKFICNEGYLVLQRHVGCVPEIEDRVSVLDDLYVVTDRVFTFRPNEKDDEVRVYLDKIS